MKQDAVKTFFEGELKRLTEKARTITSLAEAEGRALTEEESSQVEALLTEAKTAKTRIGEITDRRGRQDT